MRFIWSLEEHCIQQTEYLWSYFQYFLDSLLVLSPITARESCQQTSDENNRKLTLAFSALTCIDRKEKLIFSMRTRRTFLNSKVVKKGNRQSVNLSHISPRTSSRSFSSEIPCFLLRGFGYDHRCSSIQL